MPKKPKKIKKVKEQSKTLGVHSMSYETYRKAEGVSKSMLDIIAEATPAHLQAHLKEPPPQTPAQRLGIITHRAMLEPDTYKDGFHVRPKGLIFTTKDGKAWRDAHADRPIISFGESAIITQMVSAVHTHPFAKKLLRDAQTEKSLFVYDKNGVLRKMRLDALTDGTTIPDIKTCEIASNEFFERSISSYRYHVQAAYYLDICNLLGIEKRQWFFICVEKTPPFAVRCLQLSGDVIDFGKALYQRDLQVYRTCLETGTWPAWSDGFEEIGLPTWEMRALEQIAA